MPTEHDGFEPVRVAVLRQALARAPFEGWTRPQLMRSASDAGVSRSEFAAAFPNGVADVLRLWSADLDAGMARATQAPDFAALKIREKVAVAVRARLAALRPHKEAARRAAATLALPVYAALGARLAWATADRIWRALGDRSTDFNFYTKRAILAAVWTTTFARWLADDSADEAPTGDFLDRRIANVMQFEKVKARLRRFQPDPGEAIASLARLRYRVTGK